MKKIFFFAAAAALLAACASDELKVDAQQQTPQESDAVSFSAYLQRATTRAGKTGSIDNTTLTASDAGFGVFGYYTDNFDYTPLYTPNFMYNEKVYYDAAAYKYDLTKYWPNEHGSQAQSADQDRVSFFAYAPYVEVDPSTGMLAESGTLLEASDEKLQWGITGMKRNTLQGDPIIQYISSFDQSKCVDLCWGTTGAADVTWGTNGSTQTIKGGYPWLNVRKPSGVVGDDSRVKFYFQHALAKLAVTVKTDFSDGWTITKPAQTKVWVRSIRFTGIAHKAALNLNNPKTAAINKARWMDYYGTNELELGESVTVYDGRKDGSEGVLDAIAPNEAVLGLNPEIVQVEGQISAGAWTSTGSSKSGVTDTPVNVFRNGDVAAEYVYVIPTGEKVTVEIVYDIETIDDKLPTMLSDGETPGSTIENRISKTVTFGASTTKLESGKSYSLNLILGLKDVQFTAEVNNEWVNGGSGDAYLPNNKLSVAAGATNVPLTIPWNTTAFTEFTVSGLTNGSTVTATKDGDLITTCPSLTSSPVDASGIITVSGGSMSANESVKKKTGTLIITEEGAGSTVTTIAVTQEGKPFVLKALIPPSAGDGKSFDIEAGDGSGEVTSSDLWAAATVTVEKLASGSSEWMTLTNSGAVDALTTTYKRTNDITKITIDDLDGLVAGDKIRVTIKVGDVPPVTEEVTVGS